MGTVPNTSSTSEEEELTEEDIYSAYRFPYPDEARSEVKKRRYCRATKKYFYW